MTLEELATGFKRLEEAVTASTVAINTLVAAIAESGMDEDEPGNDLEGNPIPRERDQTQSL